MCLASATGYAPPPAPKAHILTEAELPQWKPAWVQLDRLGQMAKPAEDRIEYNASGAGGGVVDIEISCSTSVRARWAENKEPRTPA